MGDLFSVPVGYVGPNQETDDGVSTVSAVPDEAFDHRGKWVALRDGKLLAVRDTAEELWDEFGERTSEVSFFHVPTTRLFAR